MKLNRFISILLIVLLSLSVLAGCTQEAGQGVAEEPPEETPAQVKEEPAEEESVKEAGTITVTDMAGREVALPLEIESIATFGSIGVLNAFVELMGSGDKIVNDMTPRFSNSEKWVLQYEFAPQIKGAPVLENTDGEILIEEVLALNPDLCLVMSKDYIEPLESKGLNVVYFEWKETEDVKTAVALMGEALQKQDLAEDYLVYFDEMVADAEAITKDLSDEEKMTVLYGNITQFTQPHIIAEWWIAAAGGISVTNDSWVSNRAEYTQEDILKWNPNVMIVTERKTVDEIKNDPLYSDVSAVEKGYIYYIPTVAHVWGNRTVEQPLTVFWTLHKLYPDLVSEEDLAEKIDYFYSHFFKTNLSDEQIDSIINTN
ncbi:MAG: ABC transporter substrate-binding protein [Tissierellia bacterium]|nr:ABC transporter substrate-binding protein [Tissierellia bacterium]